MSLAHQSEPLDPVSTPSAKAGLLLPPGGGHSLANPALQITLKISGARTAAGSLFEIIVPAGFDVGAHVHARSEEFFYVLDGTVDLFAFEPIARTSSEWQAWRSADGDRPFRAGPGAMMHVPAGCPHGFANPGPDPARLLFQSAPPPDHERYFEELVDLLAGPAEGRAEAVAMLRERYDIQQITPLQPGAPLPSAEMPASPTSPGE
jgi:mannose-6-phosphate isomerase-like protein (cupin superfamily)